MKTAAVLAGSDTAMVAEVAGIERMLTAEVPLTVAATYSAANDEVRRLMLIEIGRSGPPLWLHLDSAMTPTMGPRGGRHRSLLNWEQEVELVRSWLDRASHGHRLTVDVMRSELSSRSKSAVYGSTIIRLLGRHGFRYVPGRSQWERHRRNLARRQRLAA